MVSESHELAILLGFNNLKNYVSIGVEIGFIFLKQIVTLVYLETSELNKI
jgi:hypothetical protein